MPEDATTDPVIDRLHGGRSNWPAIRAALQETTRMIHDEAKGIRAYDLAPPIRWPQPGDTVTCRVCGRPRVLTASPLRVPRFGRPAPANRDPHAGCDRDIQRWAKMLDTIDADPDWQAAQQAADEADSRAREIAERAFIEAQPAQDAADEVWAAKAHRLGPPGWFVDQAAARRRALREDDDR